jgi:hypothetical protein
LLQDDLAHHEVAGQPSSVLHEDDLHPVGFHTIKQGRQARPIVEILGAAHAGVTELIDDLEPMVLRVLGDGRGLAVPGIPIHLPQAAASEVAEGLDGSLESHLLRGGLKAASTAGNKG